MNKHLCMVLVLASTLLGAMSCSMGSNGPDIKAPEVHAGNSFAYFLQEDGTVLATGNNTTGALGIGTTVNATVPTAVLLTDGTTPLSGVASMVTTNIQSTWFLMQDGTVKAVGANSFGQLGVGTTDQYVTKATPVVLPTGVSVESVVSDGQTTCFITTTGAVYATGKNLQGQLGDGTIIDAHTPKLVPTVTNIDDVVLADASTFFIASDGKLWACGNNAFGQLGLGLAESIVLTPSLVGISLVDDVVVSSYYYQGTEQRVSTYILTSGHALYVCGDNQYGQLGNGLTTTLPLAQRVFSDKLVEHVYAYDGCAYFLTTGGEVWSVGKNFNTSLGYTTSDTYSATVTKILSGVDSMSITEVGPMFLKEDDTLWACGANTNGQLGIDANTNQVPVQVMTGIEKVITDTAYHVTFILTNGDTLYSCGKDSYGELGLGGSNGTVYVPYEVMTGVDHVVIARNATYYVREDGYVLASGLNANGQLGIGSSLLGNISSPTLLDLPNQ